MPKLASKLDKEDSGLPGIADRLDNSSSQRLALVVLDCSKVELDLDKASRTVTVGIRQIEEVPASRLDQAIAILQEAGNRRRIIGRSQQYRPPSVFPKGTTIDVNSGEILPPKPQVEPSLLDELEAADDPEARSDDGIVEVGRDLDDDGDDAA